MLSQCGVNWYACNRKSEYGPVSTVVESASRVTHTMHASDRRLGYRDKFGSAVRAAPPYNVLGCPSAVPRAGAGRPRP